MKNTHTHKIEPNLMKFHCSDEPVQLWDTRDAQFSWISDWWQGQKQITKGTARLLCLNSMPLIRNLISWQRIKYTDTWCTSMILLNEGCYEFNCVPLEFLCWSPNSQYLIMWLCLETDSLQRYQKISWWSEIIKVRPSSNILQSLHKGEIWTQRYS
jgi:hypothetical protein